MKLFSFRWQRLTDEDYKQVGHEVTNYNRVALNAIQNQFLDVCELDPHYVKSVLSYDLL